MLSLKMVYFVDNYKINLVDKYKKLRAIVMEPLIFFLVQAQLYKCNNVTTK